MNKTTELDNLYKVWQEKVPSYKSQFIYDGIINEKKYDQNETKVLFIAKESNDDTQAEWDYREWWSKEIKYRFVHRISEWAYGFLNNFPNLETIDYEKQLEAIQSIAFMNIKKIGGGSISDYDDIRKHLIRDKDFLLREIEIIDPDIIVGSLTWSDLWDTLLDEDKQKIMINGIEVFRWKTMKVIDYYHPSNQYPRSMNYALLKSIYETQEFKNL